MKYLRLFWDVSIATFTRIESKRDILFSRFLRNILKLFTNNKFLIGKFRYYETGRWHWKENERRRKEQRVLIIKGSSARIFYEYCCSLTESVECAHYGFRGLIIDFGTRFVNEGSLDGSLKNSFDETVAREIFILTHILVIQGRSECFRFLHEYLCFFMFFLKLTMQFFFKLTR